MNVSSIGGLRYLFNVAYGVGKAACDRMAADCALELKGSNVAMVSLWPGAVRYVPAPQISVAEFLPSRIRTRLRYTIGRLGTRYPDEYGSEVTTLHCRKYFLSPVSVCFEWAYETVSNCTVPTLPVVHLRCEPVRYRL